MKRLLVFILVLGAQLAEAQDESFETLIAKLQTVIGKVQTSSKTLEQKLELVEFSSVRYSYDEIDQKGVKVPHTSEFNFADIDPYAVRQVTQKDVLMIVLAVKNKQKLAKITKAGESEPYDEQVSIYATDVDNARVILELAKKCIPPAEKITNSKLKLASYDEMTAWMLKSVKDVSLGSKAVNQALAKGEFTGNFVLNQIETDGKTAHQEELIFNLADVNLNSLTFKISGNRFSLNMEMLQRLKVVHVVRDGQPKAFQDDITIFTNNVDEARDLKNVINMAAPLAIAKIKSELPPLKTKEEALSAVAGLVKDVKIGDKTEGQTVTPECITTFTNTEQSASATVKNVYTFNWMDINPNTVRVVVSGEKMVLELPTLDKNKVVMNLKNDKMDGYESEVNIFMLDMEVGRRLKEAVEKTIGYCKSTYKEPFQSSPTAIVEWLRNTSGEVVVEQVTQSSTIESPEPDNLNKIKVTLREVKASSSVEEIFELNFSDINTTGVDFEVKGKWLFVKMETNFKSKIIKAYKDGKIQPYAYSLSIPMKDIETARGFIAAVKKCAAEFKSK